MRGETDGENASAKRGKIGLDFAFANTHFRAERGRKGHVDQGTSGWPAPLMGRKGFVLPFRLAVFPAPRPVETDLGPLDHNRDVALRNQQARPAVTRTAAGPWSLKSKPGTVRTILSRSMPANVVPFTTAFAPNDP